MILYIDLNNYSAVYFYNKSKLIYSSWFSLANLPIEIIIPIINIAYYSIPSIVIPSRITMIEFIETIMI
jgi:hypothetical protein